MSNTKIRVRATATFKKANKEQRSKFIARELTALEGGYILNVLPQIAQPLIAEGLLVAIDKPKVVPAEPEKVPEGGPPADATEEEKKNWFQKLTGGDD